MTVERGRYYPEMPPPLPGETMVGYANRMTGADGTGRSPYDHRRFRQCSLGWHEECSDPAGVECKCPCHQGETEGVMPTENLENRFKYHAPDARRVILHTELRENVFATAVFIETHIPDGREKSLALTKLEEALFWANAAVARQ